MKRKIYFLLYLQIHFFISVHAQQFTVSDSITHYHQLSDQKDYEAAAQLSFKIADFYVQKSDFVVAKKYYGYAAINANNASKSILEARAIYKEGVTEKQIAESGKLALEEEQNYLKACVKSLKKAHNLFKKANMEGSYEDVMALILGGEAEFIIGNYKESVSALKLALRYAQKNMYNDLSYKISDLLAQNYAEMDDATNEAYYSSIHKNYKDYFQSKDSLAHSVDEIEKLATTNQMQKTELELTKVEIKTKELELENQIAIADKNMAIIEQNKLERQIMVGGIGVILVFLLIAIIANQYKRRTNRKLEEQNKQILKQKSLIEKRQAELKDEKARTDALLLNILPAPVADELRRNKKVIPRYYKMVTIMFTDFKGFTTIAAQMSPGEIVRELDACFVAFDQIIEQYEQSVGKKCVEKIKTIGDGYMCAGGVPLENDTNPTDVLRIALAMKEFMEKRKREKEAKNEPFFEIRIGINTGPVVAGVVGKKKFAYDIWGDAVNLASRMESGSEAGKINISGETYKYVKDKFFFTPRGKINTKSKGEVDMYFVDGRVRYAEAKKTE